MPSELSPFIDPRFRQALEQCQCIGAGTGWTPVHAIDAPAFLKTHSHGEFVFDWMWAQAAERAGIAWYPKLLIAAPFSPVTGERLSLSNRSPEAMAGCLQDIEAYLTEAQLTNAGINFVSAKDREVLEQSRWLARFDWQFHWHNQDYQDFDDFLNTLKRKARKNIRAERRKAHADNWQYQWVDGATATTDQLQLAYRCYQTTHALYGNLPALNQAFFETIATEMAGQFLLCIASQNDMPLAAGVFFKDQHRLYGRYWGSLVETKDIHFEVCYYQGIEYCIRHGLTWFEPGAQGEHKIKRGFLPQKTHSFHWFHDPRLHHAVKDYLDRERQALEHYAVELNRLNPYAQTPPS